MKNTPVRVRTTDRDGQRTEAGLSLDLKTETTEQMEGYMTMFTKFLRDESGAVTIDWVALTAGILLLGITLVYAIFNNGVGDLAQNINSNLSAAGANVSTGTPPGPTTFTGTN